MSSAAKALTGSSGISRCRRVGRCGRLVASTLAPQISIVILAASAGSKESPPNCSQPRVPLMSEPTPGISTITSRSSENTSAGSASRRTTRIGVRRAA